MNKNEKERSSYETLSQKLLQISTIWDSSAFIEKHPLLGISMKNSTKKNNKNPQIIRVL